MDFYNESSDLVENNQDNNFNDNKLTNINSITINNDPSDNNHVTNKRYVDNQLDKKTIVRLNDNTNDEYLQISVINNLYNLQIYNKINLVDATKIIFPKNGNDLLQNWRIITNNRFNTGRPEDFIMSTRTNSPTAQSGAELIPPIGNAFMYIETSSNNHNEHGSNVFVSFERTDIIHLTFYYNRFSSSDPLKRSMGKFEIQTLRDNVWISIYTMEKNTNYSALSSGWILLNLNNILQPNYGIKLVYSDINNAHADMCFSDITITHSIY